MPSGENGIRTKIPMKLKSPLTVKNCCINTEVPDFGAVFLGWGWQMKVSGEEAMILLFIHYYYLLMILLNYFHKDSLNTYESFSSALTTNFVDCN